MAFFSCPLCKKEVEIINFKMGLKGGEVIYLDQLTKKPLACECGGELNFIKDSLEGDMGGTFQRFGSLTPVEKQKSLKQRSHEDNKKIHAEHKEKQFYRGF